MGFGFKSICNAVRNVMSSPLANVVSLAVPALAPAIQAYQAIEAAQSTLKSLKKGGLPALMQQGLQLGLDRAMQGLVPPDALKDVMAAADEQLSDALSEAMQRSVKAARDNGLAWHDALTQALPALDSPPVEAFLRDAIAETLAPLKRSVLLA